MPIYPVREGAGESLRMTFFFTPQTNNGPRNFALSLVDVLGGFNPDIPSLFIILTLPTLTFMTTQT